MPRQSLLVSVMLHVLAAIAGFWIGSRVPSRPPRPPAREVVPLHAPRLNYEVRNRYAEGGGGQRSSLPASFGRAPVSPRPFIPPAPPGHPAPLAVASGLLEAPEFNVNAVQIGDPFARNGVPSGGRGGPGGLGDGGCCGIGDADGNRLQWNGRAEVVRLSRQPAVLFQVDPEYSDEARKARFQGSVVVAVEVGVDGKAHNLRIVRSLGLGLDERALDAVAKWKFRPGILDGRPVAAPALIEVHFRLL